MKLFTAFLFLVSMATWHIVVNSSPPTLLLFIVWIVSALACLICGIYCLRRHRLFGGLCISGVFFQAVLVVVPPLLHAQKTAGLAPAGVKPDLEERVGQRVVLEGLVSDTKCPQVQGVDAWELADYRGRRVRVSGILHKSLVKATDVDPMVANRGAGTFYSLDQMKFELLR
jgi:hypothetical protein